MEFEGVSPTFKQIHLINHHLSTNYNIMHVIFPSFSMIKTYIKTYIYTYIHIHTYIISSVSCQHQGYPSLGYPHPLKSPHNFQCPTIEFPGTFATPGEISGCNSQRAGKRRSRGCAWWRGGFHQGCLQQPKLVDLTIQNCGFSWGYNMVSICFFFYI